MYAKIFASLWDGTLYGKTEALLVFIFLLTRSNSDGFVRVVPEAIAGPTGLSLEAVLSAIEVLEAPDPQSGTKDEEGRKMLRIGPIGSWQIVNYVKYRNMRDQDTIREQTRERVRRHREDGNAPKRDVTLGNAPKRQEEGEAEGEVEANRTNTLRHSPNDGAGVDKSLKSDWKETFDDFWKPYPRKVQRVEALKSWMKLVNGHDRSSLSALVDEILDGLTWYQRREWYGRPEDKIPHAATWLNQRRWEDRHAQNHSN